MDNLFYVSHSQGGTMFYVMLSEQPEMNEKIRAAALLAPSSFLSTTQSPIFKALTKLQPFLEVCFFFLFWLLCLNGCFVEDAGTVQLV